MRHIFTVAVMVMMGMSLVSCSKNDYKNDGGVHDPHVNMTTYEYLQSKTLFSSLVHLIDRAGMKDAVNSAKTFIAVTNYGVDEFVRARYQRRVMELNDENITYTLDSIPVQELKDSLKMYIYNDDLGRDKLSVEGAYYTPLIGSIPNRKFYIKLRRTQDYGSYIDHVDYVNLTYVIGTRDATETDPDNIPDADRDMSYDIQTSGIISNTGIIHVISNAHRLFFNTEPLPK